MRGKGLLFSSLQFHNDWVCLQGYCHVRDPNPSSFNSSLLRHLKANLASSKLIHLKCISLIITLGLDLSSFAWMYVCVYLCANALNTITIPDSIKAELPLLLKT